MVDLGAVYLRGVRRIGLERNPYRAKLLFEQALLSEGAVLEDPADFVRRVNALLLG